MSLTGNLVDFGNWWLSEAQHAVLGRTKGCNHGSDCRLHIRRGPIRLSVPADDEKVELTLHDLSQHLHGLTASRRKPARVELILEDGRYLERPLSAFRLPKTRARDMALLDLQSSTPLDPADSIILFPRFHLEQGGCRYFVVKRCVLEPIFKIIEDASGRVTSIKLRTEHGLLEMDPSDHRSLTRHTRREAFTGRLTAATLTLALASALATFVHAQWRYAAAQNQLDVQIEAVEADAKEVRALLKKREKQLERIAGVRAQKQQTIPIVSILGELTRAIPDTSWVSDLSIKGEKIRVSGFSQSAAKLIATFEASPLFASPTFGAPVVKAPDVDKERFSIDMELER